MTQPDTKTIRQFLNDYFNDSEFTTFCFDYFLNVYQNFTDGMNKGQKIQLLLDYCLRQGKMPHLLANLQKERSEQYTAVFHQPSTYSSQTPEVSKTSEVSPPERNPRQIFISHATKEDGPFAHKLAADLQKNGWQVWIAPNSIRPGEKWVAAIDRGLDESGIFLVVLSPAAMASRWVRDETNDAIALEKTEQIRFFPVQLKPCRIPTTWNGYQRVSFETNYAIGLQNLLTALSKQDAGEGWGDGAPKPSFKEILLRYLRDPIWQAIGVFVSLVALSLLFWPIFNSPETNTATPTTAATKTLLLADVETPATPTITLTITPSNTPPSTETPTLEPTTTPQPTPTVTPYPTNTPPPTATLDPDTPPWPAVEVTLPYTWTRPTDNMVMVYVPAGTFEMGSNVGAPDAQDDEMPRHTVTLDAFWIDRTEVTNAQYTVFLNENGNASEGGVTWFDVDGSNAHITSQSGLFQAEGSFGDHPVTYVSWYGAQAYCEWVGGSLPTEAQWEYAARGTDNRIYPWGNQSPSEELANYVLNVGNTTPVGSYPLGASPFGAWDMAGNVWEWVADWYGADYYSSSPEANPQGPETGSNKVLRGGSWLNNQPYLRAASRVDYTPDHGDNLIGFRCLLRPGS